MKHCFKGKGGHSKCIRISICNRMLGIYGINVIRVNETLVNRGFDTYIVEGQVLCDVLVVFCIKKLLLKAKGVIQNV